MNRPSPDSSPAARIQAALDDMVAERRGQRGAAASSSAPSTAPAPLPAERRPVARWILISLLAVTVHASGIYWYIQNKETPRETVLVAEPAPHLTSAEQTTLSGAEATPAAFEPAPETRASPAADPTARIRVMRSAAPGQSGVIKYNGETIVVPSSPANASRPPGRAVAFAPVAAPAPRPANTAAEAPSRLSLREHAKAAQDHAYRHFRYKYKIGSANYAVASLNVVVDDTVEVASWNRHRSSGEAGLEYYDNSGFRRTTRRFEVLTEEKNGEAKALEITVK